MTTSSTPSAAHTTPSAHDLGLDVPAWARVWNSLLGGKDNYGPDRAVAAEITRVRDLRVHARVARTFPHRSTTAVADLGIRQFLDIGAGLPCSPDLHETAQRRAPKARVVYLDNDPVVLTYARALLTSTAEGLLHVAYADANDPQSVLREAAAVLDFSRPVAVSLHAVLPMLVRDCDAFGVVRHLIDALPSGSTLALSHCTADFAPECWEQVTAACEEAGLPLRPRSRGDVERFLTGLTLLEPGIVLAHRWRPHIAAPEDHRATADTVSDADVSLWAAVGVKN